MKAEETKIIAGENTDIELTGTPSPGAAGSGVHCRRSLQNLEMEGGGVSHLNCAKKINKIKNKKKNHKFQL